MPSLLTERKESLKAGILAALSFTLAEGVTILVNGVVLVPQWEQLSLLQVSLDTDILLSGAIGATSGFLFGVTYRYIIRSERNSHLQDGAVLAFGI